MLRRKTGLEEHGSMVNDKTIKKKALTLFL